MIIWQLDIQLHMQLVPINTEVVSLNPAHNSIQHYMIKFVSGLQRQVSVFLQGTAASSTNKTDHHNLTEILMKMALSTIPPFILQVIAV